MLRHFLKRGGRLRSTIGWRRSSRSAPRRDPDLITTLVLLRGDEVALSEMRDELGKHALKRGQRLEPHVAETLLAGYFNLIFELNGEPTGEHLLVPFTERHLRPGTSAEFVEALAAGSRREGKLPAGMTRVMAFAGEADPDHVVQFALVATAEPETFREAVRAGRDRMRESIAPYVESVGVDTTFDVVEQIASAPVD